MRRAGRGGEEGIALLAVLTVGVAIALTVHAALMLGLSMRTAAAVESARVELVWNLEARLSAAVGAYVGHGDLGAPPPAGVSARLLTWELLRLSVDSAGQYREALLWQPDPRLRLSDDSVGVRLGGTVDAGTRSRIRAATPAADPCPPGIPVSSALRDDRPNIGWGPDEPQRFGPLPFPDFVPVSPTPPAAPPRSPAAARVTQSIRLDGEIWTGALWVEGDLVLGSGSRAVGRIVVTGDLTLEGGAEIEGTIRVGGRLTIEPGALLTVAPCRSLREVVRLDWPIRRLRPLHPDGGGGGS